MPRIRIELSYEGTGLLGWQRLGVKDPTVQGYLEDALLKLSGQKTAVIGSGRTDAGVHALAQQAHFDLEKIPKVEDFVYSLNSLLPRSIRVQRAWEAPDDFHAQRSAVWKTYKYRVLNRPRPSPFQEAYAWWWRNPIDMEFLNEAAGFLVGEQDFASFQTAGGSVKTTVRTIHEARWTKKSKHVLEFTVTGSGFLKQMVRNLVGTQLDLFKKGLNPSDMVAILQACDRRKAGMTAPAQGLFMVRVVYPETLDNKCRPL